MTYDQPMAIPDHTYVSKVNLGVILPPRESIPSEFNFSDLINANTNPYFKFAVKWFYLGLKAHEIPKAKPGIDRDSALRHLQTIIGSFEPKHEHKCEAVTYLASLWFETPSVDIK